MKWITCKTEYYSWLVEVLNTKKIEQLSQNTTMFVYSKAFNIASASALKLAWPIGEDGHNFQGWLNTLMCTISRRCVWLPKRTCERFSTRFDEGELCWKFLHVFSEVAWYKKWLRLSVQSTNCALPDTFRQKFRHQFSNFSSLFRAAAASIIVKLIMIHHKKRTCALQKFGQQ